MICYIPARGSSKRIKSKNIKKLFNKPILQRVIENIQKNKNIKSIFVSTDSIKIKKLADKMGVETLKLRKRKLGNDKTNFNDLLIHDLPRFCKYANDYKVLFVLPTAVLLTNTILNKAIKKFNKEKPNCLMSSFQNNVYPSFVKKKQTWKPIFPKQIKKNTQDNPIVMTDAGCFYILDVKKIIPYKSIKDVPKLLMFELTFLNYCDVDTLADWNILKFKFQNKC